MMLNANMLLYHISLLPLKTFQQYAVCPLRWADAAKMRRILTDVGTMMIVAEHVSLSSTADAQGIKTISALLILVSISVSVSEAFT